MPAVDPRTEIELRIEQRVTKLALGLFSLFGLQFVGAVFAAGIGWQKLDYMGDELAIIRADVRSQGGAISALVADTRESKTAMVTMQREMDRLRGSK